MGRGEVSAVGRLHQMIVERLDQMTSKGPSKIQRYVMSCAVENEARLLDEETSRASFAMHLEC